MNKFFLLLTLFFTSFLFAQEQQRLEKQKQQLLKELAVFKEMLKNENIKEKSVLNKIQEQNTRIALSEKIIATTKQQIQLTNREITKTEKKITTLTKELNVLKDEYAATVVKSYKSRNAQTRIMFILSSQNFLQAYKRTQYMKQYANFRKRQGEEIIEKRELLEVEKKKLNNDKKRKEKIVAENKAEKLALEKEKKQQEKLVKELEKNKKKYAAEIDKKEKERKKIDARIKKLIAEAIAEANRKAAKKAGKTTKNVSATKFVLTPEGKIISDNFKANKGKLPWPVQKGYIHLKYGNYKDPVHRGVTHLNSGIEIASPVASKARAVFEGKVLQIQKIKGSSKAVFVQHGSYITVYQYVENVTVSVGDNVKIKQNLGTISLDKSSGKAILKFLVLKNTTTLNPSYWLSR